MNHATTERPANILLIEDDSKDIRLTQAAFKKAPIRDHLYAVRSGTEALAFLSQEDDYEDAPRPDIILLDLDLPEMDGTDLLEEIHDSATLRLIPVIILTRSQSTADIVQSYEHNANAYLTKPDDVEEFSSFARSIGEFWMKAARLPPVTD